MTAKVAIYIVIKALSQYSERAINNNMPPTNNPVLSPPTIYATPMAKVNVAMTGIPK